MRRADVPRFAAVLLAGWCTAAGGCDESPTELVLVVETDLTSAERFDVVVTHPDGTEGSATAELATQAPPRTLVLRHRSGPLEPVALRISASGSGGEMVATERVVAFEVSASRTLRVFLSADCSGVRCPAGQTCVEGARCRPVEVRECEYDGGSCPAVDAAVPDAGARDGGGSDGGSCAGVVVCGVADTHLPGDRVQPRLCTGLTSETRVLSPAGTEIVPRGEPPAYAVAEPGLHEVRAQGEGCTTSRTFEVAAPEPIAAGLTPDGELRGLAARTDVAFLAGQRGPIAFDASTWVWLDDAAPSLPEDQRDVAIFQGWPTFGPNGDLDAVHRVQVDASLEPTMVVALPFADASRHHGVRAMATPIAEGAPLVVSTHDDVVALTSVADGGSTVHDGYDPGADGWIAVGRDRPGRGGVWVGRHDELYNFPLDGGSGVNERSSLNVPSGLGNLRAAAIDDADPDDQRLWLCGEDGVSLHVLGPGDWEEADTLPDAAGRWSGGCADLALDGAGDVWVATGGPELVRLDPSAEEVARRATEPDATVSLVATARSDDARAVWAVDTARWRALRLVADPRP